MAVSSLLTTYRSSVEVQSPAVSPDLVKEVLPPALPPDWQHWGLGRREMTRNGGFNMSRDCGLFVKDTVHDMGASDTFDG